MTLQEYNDIAYWSTDRSRFTPEQLKDMEYDWIGLEKKKAGESGVSNSRPIVLESSLNCEQLIGFRLLRNHLLDREREKKQFTLRIEGTAGISLYNFKFFCKFQF